MLLVRQSEFGGTEECFLAGRRKQAQKSRRNQPSGKAATKCLLPTGRSLADSLTHTSLTAACFCLEGYAKLGVCVAQRSSQPRSARGKKRCLLRSSTSRSRLEIKSQQAGCRRQAWWSSHSPVLLHAATGPALAVGPGCARREAKWAAACLLVERLVVRDR